MIDENDAVACRDSKQCDESDNCGDGQSPVAEPDPRDPTDEGKRKIQHDHSALRNRVEGCNKDEENPYHDNYAKQEQR